MHTVIIQFKQPAKPNLTELKHIVGQALRAKGYENTIVEVTEDGVDPYAVAGT